MGGVALVARPTALLAEALECAAVRDPLSIRLPDLPHAGYATASQKAVSDAIMFLIRGLERDRVLLLEVVRSGKVKWRRRFTRAYKAIHADTEAADAVYGYLCLLAGDERTWEAQLARLQQMDGQQATRRWDKRWRTVLRHVQDRQTLDQDILRESLKPRRVYS